VRHEVKATGLRPRALAASLALLLAARPARAQLAFTVMGGTSFNLPTPLSISQQGYPDLHFTAHYETRPLETTYYYAGRLALWGKGRKAWIFDYTHQKLYLSHPPPEVQVFKITFGYNEFSLGRAWYKRGLIYSLTGGIVVGNPYSEIRGQVRLRGGGLWNSGYVLGGATIQGGLSKQFRVVDRLFLVADSRVSFSYAQMPVANGHAHVPNVALHLHFGVGYGGPRRWNPGSDS
jgi:hypothetical protein